MENAQIFTNRSAALSILFGTMEEVHSLTKLPVKVENNVSTTQDGTYRMKSVMESIMMKFCSIILQLCGYLGSTVSCTVFVKAMVREGRPLTNPLEVIVSRTLFVLLVAKMYESMDSNVSMPDLVLCLAIIWEG